MSRQDEQVWEVLHRAGLTEGAAPETGKLESPWYVKALLAFSGWLAALFFLGFIAIGFGYVFENSIAAFIIGAMMIGVAFFILPIPKNEFIEHLAMALSLAGQALVVFAIFDIAERHASIAWLLVSLLQVSLAIIMPNFVHRVFSSFAAALAFSMILTYRGWPYLVSGVVLFLASLCWLEEFRYPRQMRKIRAVGYGLVLALIQMKGAALFGYGILGWQFARNRPEWWAKPLIGEILTGVAALFVVWRLLQRYGRSISEGISIAALSGTFLLCAVSLEAQGIAVGMVILLLGFSGANRVLLGLGIVSLLFYISSYYYLLDATLLAKSRNLLFVGLALLSLRWLLFRLIPGEKEAKHV